MAAAAGSRARSLRSAASAAAPSRRRPRRRAAARGCAERCSGDSVAHAAREGAPARAARAATAAALGAPLLLAAPALAAEAAPEALLDSLQTLFDALQAQPVWETAPLYVAFVGATELVPLLPTQPVSLTAGLLFGTKAGAACVWGGNMIAGCAAFALSRAFGPKLARFIERLEGKDDKGGERGAEGEGGEGVDSEVNSLSQRVAQGGFLQQATGVFLFRLTPHPFSLSNYLLGLTPVSFPAYLAGTMTGMVPWAAFYAFVGASGRNLLLEGDDLQQIFAALAADLDGPLKAAGGATLAVGAAAALAIAFKRLTAGDAANQDA